MLRAATVQHLTVLCCIGIDSAYSTLVSFVKVLLCCIRGLLEDISAVAAIALLCTAVQCAIECKIVATTQHFRAPLCVTAPTTNHVLPKHVTVGHQHAN
jgi:hypothetical protein